MSLAISLEKFKHNNYWNIIHFTDEAELTSKK